jgi:hypothetical protein
MLINFICQPSGICLAFVGMRSIGNPSASQVWLLQNAAVRSLVIAFRGTEQVKWKDMVTDISFQPAPFNPERVYERSNSASLIRQEASLSTPCMHAF